MFHFTAGQTKRASVQGDWNWLDGHWKVRRRAEALVPITIAQHNKWEVNICPPHVYLHVAHVRCPTACKRQAVIFEKNKERYILFYCAELVVN